MPADAAEIVRLAELCEAGQVPSRDLDALIAPLQGLRVVDEGHPLGRCCYDSTGLSVVLPRYTASLDAAMTLVPEGWRLDHLGEKRITGGCIAVVGSKRDIDADGFGGSAATPALALTAAALRARAAQHDREVG